VPLQASPKRTVYSKTLRSGTTYAQYRDVEEEEKKKEEEKYTTEMIMVEEKWLCHNGQPVGRISAEVLPPQSSHVGNLCVIPESSPKMIMDQPGYYREFDKEVVKRTDALFYPR